LVGIALCGVGDSRLRRKGKNCDQLSTPTENVKESKRKKGSGNLAVPFVDIVCPR
jgi:hypothetical protein